MRQLWSLIGQKKNREILGWIGGGLVIVITGLWAAFVYFSTPDKTNASGNSIAAGRDAIGNTINSGGSQAPEQKQ